MSLECSRVTNASTERGSLDQRKLVQRIEIQKTLEIDTTTIRPVYNGCRKKDPKALILRGADIIAPIARKHLSISAQESISPAVANFQEALRLFPPFRDDDGAILGAVDVKCSDCEAIFSSSDELGRHYLTRFCPGAAVIVYVMTRDRLITKGYRIEKRIIPLDGHPLHFFCGKCERLFAVDDDQKVTRHKNTPYCVDCTHCGVKCNISYEPPSGDPRDDISFRDVSKDIAGSIHSGSPSLTQKAFASSKPLPLIPGEQTSKGTAGRSRARKLRDSWSFRKFSQSDEDELIAISFASSYDLERVHAPNGVFQQMIDCQPNTSPTAQPAIITGMKTHNEVSGLDLKRSTTTLCEEEVDHPTSSSPDSDGDLLELDDNEEHAAAEDPRLSRRQSFFRWVFGEKLSKGLSRASSASSRSGKKLIKRANTVRFSFVSRVSKFDDADDEEKHEAQEDIRAKQDSKNIEIANIGLLDLLRCSQNIYVHIQKLSEGAVVHDVSGRQRVLSMEQVALLFMQVKDEVSAATIWSRTTTTRLRAEGSLKQGNSRAAVALYHDALRMLDHTPALDVDRLSRAGMVHALGDAYRHLDMPAESEACYLEALGLYKRSLGRDHPKNFVVLQDLASLCEKDGYATEAAALFERSYAGRLRSLGQNSPETLSSMQDLAAIKVSIGDLESALFLLEKAVSSLDTVFGIQNEMTLTAMDKLSILYLKLGLEKESRAISGKMIPHCRTFFGLSSPITRNTVVRYLHKSDNFDFSAEVKDVLDQYRRSRDPDALRVIHRLGRAYMDAGLNRDASSLFETLFEEFIAVKGMDAPETFDALSALCVSREHLDSMEKAIESYSQLIHLARRTPEGHHSRKRIAYSEKRIADLNHRREVLAAEKKSWGLNEQKPCVNCAITTAALCSSCHIFRFCSEACQQASSPEHLPWCIPSVTLRESKSIAIKPRCPASARELAISKIRFADSNSIKSVNVTASYTYYLDPRNLATFRMKLNSTVNTLILFSTESDIRYTVLNDNHSHPNTASASTIKPTDDTCSLEGIDWLTPQCQEFICHIPANEATTSSTGSYLMVTPGKEMLKAIIEKRVSVRSAAGEKERFQALQLPNEELIEYVQGLLVEGYMGEAFMYVLEWMWK
ncbi:hypothetical protein ASPZODRAFT_135880 [Penicilliopsis zonata CBS 506.65]|uniref:MYND-type domain-containing protein n=1 Tax=Penicilliopsis zonata CBS 506.65 TaxID=1073090 RepID=A0A1L9S9P1_9EURO|nr:hypothetical protein ASPZODRAFT_135880 [Penicilliopsis zonata CBS 506.65]OJJ43849.1 hypothetical protein ASPZODRAFT_135880 [Penicilliopsis zonata CBS 506.65]